MRQGESGIIFAGRHSQHPLHPLCDSCIAVNSILDCFHLESMMYAAPHHVVPWRTRPQHPICSLDNRRIHCFKHSSWTEWYATVHLHNYEHKGTRFCVTKMTNNGTEKPEKRCRCGDRRYKQIIRTQAPSRLKIAAPPPLEKHRLDRSRSTNSSNHTSSGASPSISSFSSAKRSNIAWSSDSSR